MDNITQESLDLMKQALRTPNDNLAKSISVSGTGLLAYDLQAPAKNLYPFITPIRNVLPRIGGGVGSMTNWRVVSAILGSGVRSMGWVPEGQRSGKMSYTTANKSASFVTLGEEDSATFEAISAGRTFEDIQAMMAFRLLQMMMEKEEFGLLGGNFSIALGTPGTPTLTATGSGATLPGAPTTYYVKVVALTLEGYSAASLTGGVMVQNSVTGADGKNYVQNGGSSAASAEASQSVTLGNTLFCSVAAIQGAVAYAWYVSTTSGAEKLEAITTINSAAFSAPLLGTGQLVTAVTGDHSANNGVLSGGTTTAFDGLLTTALNSANNAYVKILATGTAGTGTTLTASGRGSVTEIDTMFQSMWDTFRLSPTVLYVNSQELKNITSKVLSNTAGPLLRYDSPADGSGGEYQLTASGVIQYYYNPFALNGGLRIPIRLHPNLPAGTIVGWAENLPIQYQSNEVPNVAEVKVRQDYYQLDWPIVTRERQVGVYAEEVLAVYAPFAMGVITNVANG
jgi:hypothetical protein